MLAPLKLPSRLLPSPPALLLLPRRPYLPYPSWPVPAAGPFLEAFSLLSRVGTSPGAVFVLLLNSPNLGLGFATLGLGVLVAILEVDTLASLGLRSGMIPRPDGAGPTSRYDD